MKLSSSSLILTVTLATSCIGFADTWTDPGTGYTWTYRINGDTAEIQSGISPDPKGAVTIPSTLGGKPVTSIGASAFVSCRGLTSITIPEGVTNIGAGAFSDCCSLLNIVIPASVTSIADYAFLMCSELTSVTIPDSVTSIADSAFSYCSGLTNITVGAGNASYSSVNGLLLSKDGKTLIQGVNGSVTIPDGVTGIGNFAFLGCSGLTSVMIGNSVTSIGQQAFDGCSGLRSFVVADDNPFYRSVSGLLLTKGGEALVLGVSGEVMIPDGVTLIYSEAFAGRSGLTSVTIPDSVTSIGPCAFEGCSGLTRVMIPNGVTSIASFAFRYCSRLTSVTIPAGVMSIKMQAFSGCSGLASVMIPDSVTNIEESAFSGCNGLESFSVADDNPSYKSVSGLLLSKDGKTLVCGVNGSVTIPAGVTSIGYGAFSGCSGLTGVTIPNSVTSIGDRAFFDCSGLTSMIFRGDCPVHEEDNLLDGAWQMTTYVSRHASGWDEALAAGEWQGRPIALLDEDEDELPSVCTANADGTVTFSEYKGRAVEILGIPEKIGGKVVSAISRRAFASCAGLTSITIPATVRWLDDEAFAGCSSLVSVTYLGDAPDTGANIYLGTPRTLVSYVRGGSIGWSRGISSSIPTVWNDRAMVCEWTVTFDAQGGMLEEMVRFVANEDVVGVLPSPTRDGHVFDGWFTEPAGGVRVTSATKVSGHVTYYAHWKANGTETDFVNYGGVVSDMAFAKAQTVLGALHDTKGGIVGTVALKFGKINARKGTVKISATATLLADGKAKKVAAKAVTVKVGEANADAQERVPPTVISFKAPIGEMTFEMEADGTFRLKNGSYMMVEKSVGGSWSKAGAKVWLAGTLALPAGTIEELLPDGEPVIPKGGKWSFAKAAGVKYAKDKATGEFDLVVDTKKGTNLSAMKLTYTPKTGVFKGSFKIYAIQDGKLKKITVKVIGVVVDGKGWGCASGPGGVSFAVTVE